eukprot:CAMPEP_0185844222 /NCGR_PEP_ID=MMETSP1354-20130828/464_1 /TAXON_ID=708628 /ORGANISM="Erythrolobus madagascarensis, Strain CCMP3276" /LENGTH=181 /DNA_ID=CAMNT_0028543849 /DNA_START=228 /DNA_END=773 /DNA_ORIENTATION=+
MFLRAIWGSRPDSAAKGTTEAAGEQLARLGQRKKAPSSGFAMEKTEEEWKKELSKEEYHVLRQKGTERPHTGEYNKFYPTEGHFACRACGNPLYSAKAKFDSGCGWPAFDKTYAGALKTNVDRSFGSVRTEIVCARCGGHLGHVFSGEGFTQTNERHCVNSLSIKFVEEDLQGAPPESKVT